MLLVTRLRNSTVGFSSPQPPIQTSLCSKSQAISFALDLSTAMTKLVRAVDIDILLYLCDRAVVGRVADEERVVVVDGRVDGIDDSLVRDRDEVYLHAGGPPWSVPRHFVGG